MSPLLGRCRLDALLSADDAWDEAKASRVTLDEHDGCAERLMWAWAGLLPDVPEVRTLAAWARHQGGVDPETARRCRLDFHRLHREAVRLTIAHLLGHGPAELLTEGLGLGMVLQEGVDDLLAGDRVGLDAGTRTRLVSAAWDAAQRHGPSDALDQLRFVNVLTEGKEPGWLGLSSPPMPAPGGPTSLFQTRRVPFMGLDMPGGPVFRLVMDLSTDGALYAMAGGASERPFGPGYGKGLEAWRTGAYRELGPRRDRSA